LFPRPVGWSIQRFVKGRLLWGHWLYVAGLRLEAGELLIVVTNYAPDKALRAVLGKGNFVGLVQLHPLTPKPHGSLPKTIFHLGLDFLRRLIFHLHHCFHSIKFFPVLRTVNQVGDRCLK
jgi:hypothetical protein